MKIPWKIAHNTLLLSLHSLREGAFWCENAPYRLPLMRELAVRPDWGSLSGTLSRNP